MLQDTLAVSVGVVGIAVGDTVDTAVVVALGWMAAGVDVGSWVGGTGDEVGVLVVVETTVSVVATGTGLVAQPRNSIRSRIASRMRATINLNKS